ncbi:FtsX-like permease family protein [Myxococcota bacterium]|nr:FtsX-like permease family protein [Myxococcota bacterium]
MDGPSLSRLAWRNLWRNTRRTLLTMCAITFGLMLAVMFTALQDRSFGDMIDLAARMASGHVVVQHPEYLDSPSLQRTVPDADAVAQQVAALPGVARAVPRISGPVMLATAGQSYGAYFLAVDPAREDAGSLAFVEALTAGELLDAADGKGIVLGARLARNLKLELGDKVVYTLMDKNGEIASGLARLQGTVTTGADSTDGALAILPIDAVRQTLAYGAHEATQVAVYSDDARRSARVRDTVAATLGEALRAATWDEVNPELSGFISMKVGGARFMEAVIMVLVAASIFNTLFVSVLERRREFGIMMAIGYTGGQVFRLVMWESFWLALVGILMGLLVTAGPYLYLASHPIDLTEVYAQQGQSMDIAGIGMSPLLQIGIYPENLALILLGVVLATMLSGLYPAWQAGRTVPVQTIKLV